MQPPHRTLLFLPHLLVSSTAQLIGEIGDGQIQAPTAASAPEASTPPAAMMSAEATNAPIIITATSPCPNATLPLASGAPMQLPSAKAPLFSANTSMPTGTGMMGGGANASVPTVPAAPTMAGEAPTEEGGSSSTGGAPKEAGTSAPAVAASSGAGRGVVGWGLMGAVVGWGVWVFMMG